MFLYSTKTKKNKKKINNKSMGELLDSYDYLCHPRLINYHHDMLITDVKFKEDAKKKCERMLNAIRKYIKVQTEKTTAMQMLKEMVKYDVFDENNVFLMKVHREEHGLEGEEEEEDNEDWMGDLIVLRLFLGDKRLIKIHSNADGRTIIDFIYECKIILNVFCDGKGKLHYAYYGLSASEYFYWKHRACDII